MCKESTAFGFEGMEDYWPEGPPALLEFEIMQPRPRNIFEVLHSAQPDNPVVRRCPHWTYVGVHRTDAAELIKEHGGKGGNFAADLLMEENNLVGMWVVTLQQDKLVVEASWGPLTIFSAEVGYDDLGVHQRMPRLVLREDGPCQIPIYVKDCFVMVHGSTIMDTGLATYLARTVLHAAYHRLDGDYFIECFDDDALAELLLARYAEYPRAVAEAVMALKKPKGNLARPLLRVLWGRPELRKLAKQVQAEITGA